ncbi:Peptidoglycan binding-like [Parasponia andersonii]|uniref:Peptidoglycan binding-like n=1 Tax=Parasponia andersonii TaxID=3476 RepID=A0A2P5CFJ2_PARAD|nr:Peptidoglycan binding-like [Parasponia andersonii]
MQLLAMEPKSPPLLRSLLVLVVIPLSTNTIQSKSEMQQLHYAFKFIQSFVGSQKGQNVPGLYQLTQYLQRFMYMNYQLEDEKAQYDHNDLLNDNNINEFDEDLESAIKSYQRNYNLKVTGTLDQATVKQMMIPRCGLPEIMSSENHNDDMALIGIFSHNSYSYFPGNRVGRKPT